MRGLMRLIGVIALIGMMGMIRLADAQTTTLRRPRIAATTRAAIGTATFSATSPLALVGLPTQDGTLVLVDGSGTVGTSGAVGQDVDPSVGYAYDLGQLTKKWLTLHAAELWVETLVAQNTIATIGGRILVGPTTTLTADLAAAATTLSVKHNSLQNGDIVYLEVNGAVEFLAITSAASGTGPYTYSVTRNLDGTGANAWSAGDAVFDTGQTGSGWIDLYSVRGVKASSEAGPTIVGNVRASSTYNDWAPRWALGNLNGLYGYGATTYGAAFGVPTGTNITVDATNGYRVRSGTTTLAQWAADGTITIGALASNNTGQVQIDSDSIDLRWKNGAGAVNTAFAVDQYGVTVYTPLYARASVVNDEDADFPIRASQTGASVTVTPGAGGAVRIGTAYALMPTADASAPGGLGHGVELGQANYRWNNIHLLLPENTSPAYVVVNKGGAGADANTALGYIVGWSGCLSGRAVVSGVVTSTTC